MAWTNLGKQKMFEEFFCSGAVDETFRLVLCTSAGNWDASSSDTSAATVASSLANAAGTEGGTSGLIVVRDGIADGAHFDVSSSTDLGTASSVRAVLQTVNDAFQYSGTITNARYVAMVAAGAQGSAFNFSTGSNNIYAWWDIGSNTNINSGNTLTITSLSLQGQ